VGWVWWNGGLVVRKVRTIGREEKGKRVLLRGKEKGNSGLVKKI